jgi:hypothetical protein
MYTYLHSSHIDRKVKTDKVLAAETAAKFAISW